MPDLKKTIKCKKCGEEIEISDALTHQIEEQVIATLTSKHELEIEEVKKLAILEAAKKATSEFESKISTLEKEKDEERERSTKLTQQIDQMLTEMRDLRRKDEEREIEMKKKMMEDEDRIKREVREKADEEHRMHDMEKEKVINDLRKSLEDAQRKAMQGSQQTQGESLELEIEARLKAEFPSDIISEVKKGQRGADAAQEVYDKLGRKCGVILWESKNAKWAGSWIAKLKEDQRQAKADIAVLVCANLPEGIDTFTYRDGVWIASFKHFVALAWALRFNLVSLFHERVSHEGKDEKMKVLYQYLTGPEFKHRVEGIVEAFSNMQHELEREKRWFSVKWARQEKEIRRVMDHTHGMYGDLQGVVGKSLPEIKTLEIEAESSE